MATAGLSFANPFLGKVGLGPEPNPYTPFSPTSSIGAGGLGQSLADMALLGESLVPAQQFTLPPMRKPPGIAYSPSRKELYVQGARFTEDDAAAALQSEALLGQEPVGIPQGEDWIPVSESAYAQYLGTIRNPSLGTLAKKGFGRGVDIAQLLAGRGLQLAGAEELGGRVVQQQMEDLRKSSPYERRFTDIESGRGAIEWLVANFAEQGPNLIESIATAAIGFLGGTVASGTPISGAGAALAGLVGKGAWKESVKAALSKQARGEALSNAETKLLREAAGIAGAIAATSAQNLATGAADIYGELREQGAGPDDTSARIKALAGSIPYAALETLSEFTAARALIGGGLRPALPAGATLRQRGAELLKRGAIGGAVGGTLEGLTELGQEGLVLGIPGQDLTSPASVDRLINSFAAGFGIGGPIGAAANLRSRKPYNLTNPSQDPEQRPGENIIPPPTLPATAMQGTQGELFAVPAGPTRPSAPTGPTPSEYRNQLLSERRQLVGFVESTQRTLEGMANGTIPLDRGYMDQAVQTLGRVQQAIRDIDQQIVSLPTTAEGLVAGGTVTPTAPGQLGLFQPSGVSLVEQVRLRDQELARQREEARIRAEQELGRAPIFPAGPMMQGEMRLDGGQGVAPEAVDIGPPAPMAQGVPPVQGVLQFAPPAPEPQGPTAVGNALQQAIQRQQMAQAQQQRDAMLNAQREAEMQQLANIAAAQRQLDLITEEPPAGLAPAPMRQAGPTQPQQMELFTRRQAPRPSRTEGLRRGIGTRVPEQEGKRPLTPKERLKQRKLFTLEGKPTMEALKSAGERRQLPPQARVERVVPKRARGLKRVGVASVERKGQEERQQEALKTLLGKFEDATKPLKRLEFKLFTVMLRGIKTIELARNKFNTLIARGNNVLKVTEYPDSIAAKELKRLLEKYEDIVSTLDDLSNLKDTPQDIPPGIIPRRSMLDRIKEETETYLTPEFTAEFDTLIKDLTPKKPGAAKAAESEKVELIPGALRDTEAVREVTEAFSDAEGAKSTREFQKAIAPLVEYAYLADENTNNIEAIVFAREVLKNKAYTDAQHNAIDAVFLEKINQRASVEARYSRGKLNGNPKPWYDYATDRGLLPKITTRITGLSVETAQTLLTSGQIKSTNLPADTIKKIKKAVGPAAGPLSKPNVETNAAITLAQLIRDTNTHAGQPYNEAKRQSVIKEILSLWKKVQSEGLQEYIDQSGRPLASYFNKAGVPFTGRVKGQLRVGVEEITEARRAKLEADIDAGAVEDDIAASRYTLDDWNTFSRQTIESTDDVSMRREEEIARAKKLWNSAGTTKKWDELTLEQKQTFINKAKASGLFFRDNGTPIRAPLAQGRVKMLVSAFLAKLKVKPKVQVYRNQADFKAKNPSLYAQAVASRPQGDFDTASAVGYSFGDGNVIIFSDRVATEKQLRFVLAHETLGHFGFRGLMTERELGSALDAAYNSSTKVKNAVDAAMASRNMSRREATEEYLADFAGMLDTNIIARFWNAVKNILNKLGVGFDDDIARYLVSQSRRYVRNGQAAGSFVEAKALMSRVAAIEGVDDPDGSGRFALASDSYSDSNRAAADAAFGVRSFKLFDLTERLQDFKDKGIDLKDVGSRLLNELRTMNFASRQNLGYRRLYEIFRDTNHTAARLRAQYNKMMDTVLSPSVEVLGRAFSQGATEAQIATTSAMLHTTSAAKLRSFTDADLSKMGSLITIVDGQAQIDEITFRTLANRGKHTLEEFRKGVKYTVTEAKPMTDAERKRLEAERDAEIGKAKTDKERDAITREYQKLIDAPSYMVDVERTFAPMPDLTEDSLEWKMYNEVRDTMNQSAVDMLMANFAAANGERVNVERVVRRFLGRELTDADKKVVQRIEDKYLTLRAKDSKLDDTGILRQNKESVNRANDFIAKVNAALLGKDKDRYETVKEFLESTEVDDFLAGLDTLRSNAKMPQQGQDRFSMQQAIQNLALFEFSKIDAESFAKRSIAGGYVPFGREGTWQVRVQAVDPQTGRVYKVAESYRERLFFAQVDSRSSAEATAERVQAVFDESEGGFRMEVFEDGQYVIRDVKLVAQPETARQTVTATSEANLNEIIAAITRFSINLTPEAREKITVALTEQNAKARTRLRRAGTPGEDPNTIKYVSQHLESTASTVARKQNRHRLDKLFDENDRESQDLWRGSKQEYDRRKAAWEAAQKDPAMPEALREKAKRDFDDYHYTFVTNESTKTANRYIDMARRAVAFMESQRSVEYTDFASGEAASAVRTATTFAFMGASFATAILNYMSLATNVLPAFSGYNRKNAFGGGFGWSMSSVELTKATADTKGWAQSEVKFWDNLLADPKKLKESGFTEAEATFMQKEVGGGTMQAALTNSLLGSARGKFRSGATKRAAETWMSLFNYTEQHSRRATGLAAFRMAYDRAVAEGKSQAEAFVIADQFAVDMIDNTLGEYAMYNRPAMFRGDVRQFMFMFKMFPVNAVQMLAALPRKEQLLALAILTMFAGLKGLPFAEDLMDIIDTIAQALGLGPSALWKGSAERTLAESLDAVLPGMTPTLMKGVLNTFTPANVADRVSLSNIVPGSGIGLAGADVGRELIEIGGPVASFMQGAAVMATDVARWGIAQPLGISPDTTTLKKIFRESPVVMLRAAGDVWAYDTAGAIVNRRGYVVSEDLHWGTVLSRLLGFYPASATAENDAIQVAKRIGDYRKEIVSIYTGAYVSAALADNAEGMDDVQRMVDDWNEAASGTDMEITGFNRSANRALRAARRTATERFIRTQPRALRDETNQLLRLYGINEE